jgi:hypothetical protein
MGVAMERAFSVIDSIKEARPHAGSVRVGYLFKLGLN